MIELELASSGVSAGAGLKAEGERWEPGDVVLSADGGLWVRAAPHDIEQGWPWAYVDGYVAVRSVACAPPSGSVEEAYPQRPLLLLIRHGQPVAARMLGRVRELLLAGGGVFENSHSPDAAHIANVAEAAGLRVEYEPCEGCDGELLPELIRPAVGGQPSITANAPGADCSAVFPYDGKPCQC